MPDDVLFHGAPAGRPQFAWRCRRGHEHGPHPTRGEAERLNPDRTCYTCDRTARLVVFTPRWSVATRNDIPAHYSMTFDQPVRSGSHFRELQRKHGTKDWEPVKGSTMETQLRRKGLWP